MVQFDQLQLVCIAGYFLNFSFKENYSIDFKKLHSLMIFPSTSTRPVVYKQSSSCELFVLPDCSTSPAKWAWRPEASLMGLKQKRVD